MEFKKICINGISYGGLVSNDENYIENIESFTPVSNVDFRDSRLIDAIKNPLHPEHNNIQ